MYEHFGRRERRQRHFVRQGVFMGAGAAVHCVCTTPPQPGQKQRILTLLQTDAGTKVPANPCAFCRYNCMSLTVHVGGWFPHKGAIGSKVNMCLLPSGNVLLLLVFAARLSPSVHTYMLLSIVGLELLVALPCLLSYTGMVTFLIMF